MKREIKFRGKREDSGEWVYGSLLGRTVIVVDYNTTQNIHHGKYNYLIETERYIVNHETVGQFTGLTYQNVNDIYEDDVFRRWLEDAVQPNGGIWAYHVVTWIEDRWLLLELGFNYKGDYRDEWTLAKELSDPDWEYVGSIHDTLYLQVRDKVLISVLR